MWALSPAGNWAARLGFSPHLRPPPQHAGGGPREELVAVKWSGPTCRHWSVPVAPPEPPGRPAVVRRVRPQDAQRPGLLGGPLPRLGPGAAVGPDDVFAVGP